MPAGRRMNGEGSVYHRASDDRWVGRRGDRLRRQQEQCKSQDGVGQDEDRSPLRKMKSVRRQIDDGLAPADRTTG